jgi:cell wall assembly regulator SMI1
VAFPIDEKYILKAEEELEVRFPNSFREKMMLSNGGEFEVEGQVFFKYPFYDMSDKKRIKRTCNSIVHETKKGWEDYGLPRNLIAIGDNGSGDTLVFNISNGILEPTVYWLDHETRELNKIADDFSEIDN